MIQPGNIIILIGKSLYTGFNGICVGVFGIPIQYAGLILGSIAFALMLFAIFSGMRRKNSFSLDN
jgi:hypothetical protein